MQSDLNGDLGGAVSESAEIQVRGNLVKRPVGVSIFAVLHLVGGVLLLGLMPLLLLLPEEMGEALRSIGIPPALLIVGVAFLAALALGSGVGLWKGARWGWWLAALYYAYGIARNGSAVWTVAMADASLFEDSDRGSAYYLVKHGLRIVTHSLFLAYFFKSNVLSYFALEGINKAKVAGVLAGSVVVVGVLFSAASFLMS